MSKICVTILSYNGQNELQDCIESLFLQETPGHEIQIHVLDNDSKDDSWSILEQLVSQDKRLKIFKSDVNTGFAGGHNILISQAIDEFDYFLLFNQDARAFDKNLISHLLQHTKELNDQALIQPALMNNLNEIAGAGSMVTYFGLGAPTTSFYNKAKEDLFKVDVTQFAAVLIPTEILQKVGLLSEIYFAYHEDLDYAQMARLYGFENYSSKKALIYHDQQPGKFKQKKFGMYLAERNRYYYLLSHFSWPTLFSIMPILVIQELTLWYFFWSNQNFKGKLRANSELIKNWHSIMEFRSQKRELVRQSSHRKEFYNIHRGAFDASKLLDDPQISGFAKLILRILNFVFQIYRPIYLIATRLWP